LIIQGVETFEQLLQWFDKPVSDFAGTVVKFKAAILRLKTAHRKKLA